MSNTQQGFTLIELMIVVAIIGILAAVAIPAYQSYIARAQVAEAISLMTGLKQTVEEYLGTVSTYPTTGYLVSHGVKISGNYVSTISYSSGAYNATMRSNTNSEVRNKTISFSYDSTNQVWRCRAGSSNGISATYLPSSCQ